MSGTIELKPNQTIVFIGDSITDTDRNLPAYRPFGFGFVHFTANLLLAKYPQLNLNIINTGISGNTVRDLKGRWQKDCIRHKPDILNVLIGINDLWRQYEGPEQLPQAVYLNEYESTYRQLLSAAVQQYGCQIVLVEPFMFCSDTENEMFIGLADYIGAVHRLAVEFEAVLVSMQKFIDEQIEQVPDEKWSLDYVHPYVWAHAWLARRWFEVTQV